MAFETLTRALTLASNYAGGALGGRSGPVVIATDTPALRTVIVRYRLGTVRVHLAPSGETRCERVV